MDGLQWKILSKYGWWLGVPLFWETIICQFEFELLGDCSPKSLPAIFPWFHQCMFWYPLLKQLSIASTRQSPESFTSENHRTKSGNGPAIITWFNADYKLLAILFQWAPSICKLVYGHPFNSKKKQHCPTVCIMPQRKLPLSIDIATTNIR